MDAALVTGASGFIGTRLVRRLSEAGTAVVAVDLLPPREVSPNVDYRILDVTEPLDPAIAAGVGTIYNLAAIHRTPGHPPHDYYRTNVLGALNITALAAAAKVSTIVFTSSISVHGVQEGFVTEATPLAPASDYGRSKVLAEEVHRRWREGDDARRLVIARPGVVFGPGERGNYSLLAQALKRRLFVYPGRRDVIKSGGYVDELVETFAFALDKAAHGVEREVCYTFAFPTPATTEDIVAAFNKTAGLPRARSAAPLPLLMAAAFLFEVAAALGVKTPIHRERVRKLATPTAVAPRWLLDNGYVFRRDLASALDEWRRETDGRFD